jgi:hypothetical protein
MTEQAERAALTAFLQSQRRSVFAIIGVTSFKLSSSQTAQSTFPRVRNVACNGDALMTPTHRGATHWRNSTGSAFQ